MDPQEQRVGAGACNLLRLKPFLASNRPGNFCRHQFKPNGNLTYLNISRIGERHSWHVARLLQRCIQFTRAVCIPTPLMN